MNLQEALTLLELIQESDDRREGDIRELSQEEYVILMSDGVYLWGLSDWKRYRKGKLAALV